MTQGMSKEMTIQQLIHSLQPTRVIGPRDGSVSGIVFDSRRVIPGSAFFALRGVGSDGYDFIDAALQSGAGVVVMERERALPAEVVGLVVTDARQALAAAAAEWFGNPTREMKVIGVTGTNGKTTVTWLLEAILRAAGLKPAVIGTVSYRFGGREVEASHTTPDPLELQKLLAEFAAAGADALVMEVSSHALEQKRVFGIHFDVGVFTNLTPEHLDYHRTMSEYYLSKKRLFTEYVIPGGGTAVINRDDPYGRRLEDEINGCVSCGTDPYATVHPHHAEVSRHGIEASITLQSGELAIRSGLLGPFNLSNLLCAVAAAEAAGMPAQAISDGVAAVANVPGRLERVVNDRGALILVDYAHTGDALDNVLRAVRDLQPQRILTVFGCGGDRDKTKRPVMGEVAARYSEIAIVTSDNPRTEDPAAIIADILPGVRQHHAAELTDDALHSAGARGYRVVPDRRAAIRLAVSLLQDGDLLLVAGKGHEDYQIIGSEKRHFDDREEIAIALREGGRG